MTTPMKTHLNKEKLLFSRISSKLKFLKARKCKERKDQSRKKKTMDLVGLRLESWVAEGKYRLWYESMDSILEDLGLTAGELSMYCTAKLKKNFLSWRKELRMEEAKRLLLKDPEMPASKIGKSLGINDKSNFRHQFKSVTGLTPSQWREKFQKK